MKINFCFLSCFCFLCHALPNFLTAAPNDEQWADVSKTLYLSRNTNPTVLDSVAILRQAIEYRFGHSPDIRYEPILGSPKGIHIGHSLASAQFDDDPLTDEIYVSASKRGIEISGQDNTATVFAISRFAQEFLGLRIYNPDPIGIEMLDEPPSLPDLGSPKTLLRESPGYYSRTLHSLAPRNQSKPWELFQGLRERFSFNHAFHKQIRPEFFDTHPEWFAKDEKGNPQKPPFDKVSAYNDQPNLLSEETFDRLFTVASLSLKSSTNPDFEVPPGTLLPGDDLEKMSPVKLTPGMASISFGLHDSFIFGSLPENYPYKPDGFFRRWPDYSNHVFNFSNKLAEALSLDWQKTDANNPGKRDLYFGTLAYLMWENVPDFPVHPQIVPYMTFGRSNWYDPKARMDDLNNVEKWQLKGTKVLGTWDYLFGFGFFIPRSMSAIVADSIPALFDRGVRAYFSQISSIWPYDGHTTWLTAKLLWNPHADPEALLSEYYNEYYGPAASPMRAFFDHAESIWMSQKGTGWWLRWWQDPWQASLYSEADLVQMRNSLNKAMESAMPIAGSTDKLPADRFIKRVLLTENLFTLTEAFVRLQHNTWKLTELSQKEDIGSNVVDLAKDTLNHRATFNQLIKSLPKSSNLYFSLRGKEWGNFYETISSSLFASLLKLTQNKAAGKDTGDQTFSTILKTINDYNFLLDPKLEPITEAALNNPSSQLLPDPKMAKIDDDRFWPSEFLPADGLEIVEDAKNSQLTVSRSRRGFYFSYFHVVPGAWHFAEAKGHTNADATSQVFIRFDFFDSNLKLLTNSPRSRILPINESNTDREFYLPLAYPAPKNAAYARVYIRFYQLNMEASATFTDINVRAYPEPDRN